MLKIKDNINLEELKKFGFINKDDNTFCKKVYLYNENDDKNFYEINTETRIIDLKRLDGELDDTLFDLIEAGLVEKIYSKIKLNSLYGKYVTLELKLKEFSEIIKNTFKKDYHEINIVVDKKYLEDINKGIEFFIELKNAYGVTQINFTEKVSDFMKNYTIILSSMIKHIHDKLIYKAIERGF